MEYILHHLQDQFHRIFKSNEFPGGSRSFQRRILQMLEQVRSIGATVSLDDYEKRKLRIFNQLNFLQLITGIIAPMMAILSSGKFPIEAWYLATSPALISILVLILNANHKYEAALLAYFILYPVFTCAIYINRLDLGIELSFIWYGILAVFFLKDIGYMLFAIALTMVSYFMLSVAWKDYYKYQLSAHNYAAYLINQGLAIIYIFYGLYLIKRENTDYQVGVVNKNTELHKKNLEIEEHQQEIIKKAKQLEKQASELRELNSVKNKLFSIISHDLKAPMYALRNFFDTARQLDLPPEEIKEMLPEVIKDLNYTTGLMENLLQWAKFQMQSDLVHPQRLNVNEQIHEVVELLHLQSQAKRLSIGFKEYSAVYALADKNIVQLVLRNLLSNAIKFTPENGRISIRTSESSSYVTVSVQDSGMGISKEDVAKINRTNFYSTNGTNSEVGTGLGLMLCKEFLARTGGQLLIESTPGIGSTFSFTLPRIK